MSMNAIQFQPGLSLPRLQSLYGTEQQCESALVAARWSHGWQCAHCGCKRHFLPAAARVASSGCALLDWWQSNQRDGIEFVATSAQHFSGRGLRDDNQTLWAPCVICDDDNNLRIFFSGDSGYFEGFKAIGENYGPFDITLMETGAYNNQCPYVHRQPEETLQAH